MPKIKSQIKKEIKPEIYHAILTVMESIKPNVEYAEKAEEGMFRLSAEQNKIKKAEKTLLKTVKSKINIFDSQSENKSDEDVLSDLALHWKTAVNLKLDIFDNEQLQALENAKNPTERLKVLKTLSPENQEILIAFAKKNNHLIVAGRYFFLAQHAEIDNLAAKEKAVLLKSLMRDKIEKHFFTLDLCDKFLDKNNSLDDKIKILQQFDFKEQKILFDLLNMFRVMKNIDYKTKMGISNLAIIFAPILGDSKGLSRDNLINANERFQQLVTELDAIFPQLDFDNGIKQKIEQKKVSNIPTFIEKTLEQKTLTRKPTKVKLIYDHTKEEEISKDSITKLTIYELQNDFVDLKDTSTDYKELLSELNSLQGKDLNNKILSYFEQQVKKINSIGELSNFETNMYKTHLFRILVEGQGRATLTPPEKRHKTTYSSDENKRRSTFFGSKSIPRTVESLLGLFKQREMELQAELRQSLSKN